MAISYFFGDTMVELNEVLEKNAMGVFAKFNKTTSKGIETSIQFRNGVFSSKSTNDNSGVELPNRTPIGIGKPLSIEILSVYTGDAPNKVFGGKKDMLVVSGVRSANSHEESPRAINQILKKAEDHQYIQPSAFCQGSPIVYYKSAVDVSTILCSFEIVADTFSEQTFDLVSKLFTKTASIPLFFTSSQYLLAGSSIIKMAGDLGKALFESKAFLKGDIPFYYDSPDMPIAYARAAMAYNTKDSEAFEDYKPGFVKDGDNIRRSLVHKETCKEYRGNAPYILVSIDGRNRDEELKNFTPKIAATSVLEKFYGSNIETQSTEILETAIMLYNDMNYHNKAKKLKEEISKMQPNSKEYRKAKDLLNAYKANILNELFKLK